MSTRSKIPAEVKRQVQTESGDCCAVCGRTEGLEFAHIRAWSKSQEHSAENLIYLCAGCHARADREKWIEVHLRRYKDKPWIIRKEWEPPPGVKVKVTITVVELESNGSNGIDLESYLRAALAGHFQQRAESKE
jgi:type I restriction enzyme R subunit